MAAPAAVAAGWGLAVAWWTPRGPLTNGQALCSVVISTAVGLVAGRVGRSRWALLTAPVGFVVALELARAGVRGPSVDAPHLSAFGLIALVTGRGVHGVLSVLPMALGAAYGCGLRGRSGRVSAGVCTAALVAVTVAVALPGHTPRVPGRHGIAELSGVDVGGHRLGVLIRGADRGAPVLLFVPGAPGGSETGAMRRHLGALERRFVVVTLDRRGGGSSYPALDPTATATLAGAVNDVLTVTDRLRHRFHQDRIFLLAHSGGSIPGVLAVQRHPEKYRAYIGTGQAVDLAASDRIFYADILAWARSHGRVEVVRQLTRQGPPPYRDVWSYEPIMRYENEVYGQPPPDLDLGASEYPLLQRLQAPHKQLAVFPGAGHRAMFEQPDRMAGVLAAVLADC